MQVLGKARVIDFIEKHPDCAASVNALVCEIEAAEWHTPHELKARYPKASIVGNQNVIFNLCGNKYRAWLRITYPAGVALVVMLGTHQEYDKWEIR